MRWRPLSTGIDGVRTDIAFDDDGKLIARHTQSDTAIKAVLDHNATARNHTPCKTADGSMVHAASIPAWVIAKWWNEEGLDVYNAHHGDRLMKKLNDPDWAYLRTGGGHLAMQQDGTFR